MGNLLSTQNNQNEVSTHPTAHGEFKNFLHHFWNMVEMPHSRELTSLEPKISVTENKENVVVAAEIPGVSENDMDVSISSDGYLTISGEKKEEKAAASKDSYFSEISYGTVKRTIPLPWDLDYNKADAQCADGVLTITIPKTQTEKQKVKKINVKKSNKN